MYPVVPARRALALAVVVLALAAPACSGPCAEGEAAFRDGHYPQAKQALARLEAESRSWGEATRAEYALYRGLTLAALGDRGTAAEWLDEARAIEDRHPGSLVYDDARRLSVAIDTNAFP